MKKWLILWLILIGGIAMVLCANRSTSDPVRAEAVPCSLDIPCHLTMEDNGDRNFVYCKVHEPDPLVFDASDVVITYVDSGIDPNDCWLDLDMTMTDICIATETGGDLYLSFKGDRLEITGDADLNEAAKAFFYEHLKPMADEYIKERLGEKKW